MRHGIEHPIACWPGGQCFVQAIRVDPMQHRFPHFRYPKSRRPCLKAVMRMVGLRPTRQRLALAELLFSDQQRHVSAEQLFLEASDAGVKVSLATVYNCLHQFCQAGLLRQVTVASERTYFDTDTSNHHHFYLEDERRIVDIPPDSVRIGNLPAPPKGMKVSHVDVVVTVRRKT